jgi:hypothetical protein
MAEKRRQESERWPECEGARFLQRSKPWKARFEAARAKTEDGERRRSEEEFLCSDARDEIQAYIEQNCQRPKF